MSATTVKPASTNDLTMCLPSPPAVENVCERCQHASGGHLERERGDGPDEPATATTLLGPEQSFMLCHY